LQRVGGLEIMSDDEVDKLKFKVDKDDDDIVRKLEHYESKQSFETIPTIKIKGA
jgi:hypothetical protein